jgi:prepilin-type N-terminal cleavage/methylation domain-containing protein
VDSRSEQGFTLVELLVNVLLLAIVSIAFYTTLFAASRAADTSRAVTKVSEEARLGFSRMVRDTRQGRALVAANDTSYTVEVDFDGDGVIERPYGTVNSQGDYEVLTFSFNQSAETVTLNGEVLMRRVQCTKLSGVCGPVFEYTSNRLEYDWAPKDGIATWEELDQAPAHGVIGVGNNNGILDSGELPFISNVSYELTVVEGDASTQYIAEAQLRNLR